MCVYGRVGGMEGGGREVRRVSVCGHEGRKRPGTQREKNIRCDSEESHGTSTHTSFCKSLTHTRPLISLTQPSGLVRTQITHYTGTHTHTHLWLPRSEGAHYSLDGLIQVEWNITVIFTPVLLYFPCDLVLLLSACSLTMTQHSCTIKHLIIRFSSIGLRLKGILCNISSLKVSCLFTLSHIFPIMLKPREIHKLSSGALHFCPLSTLTSYCVPPPAGEYLYANISCMSTYSNGLSWPNLELIIFDLIIIVIQIQLRVQDSFDIQRWGYLRAGAWGGMCSPSALVDWEKLHTVFLNCCFQSCFTEMNIRISSAQWL